MFGFEKILDSKEFFAHGGWFMAVPVVVAVIVLVLAHKMYAQAKLKNSAEKVAPPPGTLPDWVTLLSSAVCLGLGGMGLWIGIMGGLVHQSFGYYSNQQFYGLFEITGVPAVILGLLLAGMGGLVAFLGFYLLGDLVRDPEKNNKQPPAA